MNKKISLGAAIAFMLVVATLTLALTMAFSMNRFTDMVNGVQEQRELYAKLSEIEQNVRDKYPDALDNDALMDAMAGGYIDGLGDEGNAYYTAAEYQQMISEEGGRYYGVGVVTAMEANGYIQISEVYPDSPAANAQIVVGDIIVKVDDIDVTSETYDQAIALLRGEAGTKVTLTLRRNSEDITMELTSRQVEVPTVYSQNYDRVEYLRITNFSTGTRDQFNRYLNAAIGDGRKALIIDVRDNAGGRYTGMTPVLELLVPEGNILMAQYKTGEPEILATSSTQGAGLPLVVLTNQNTTGTAEVFAQSLKELAGADIVGVNTAGEGKLQELFQLSDGSAIQLTVGRFVTPDGYLVDGVGVSPDYEVQLESEQVVWENLSPEYDTQLAKAMELAEAVINVGAANTETAE